MQKKTQSEFSVYISYCIHVSVVIRKPSCSTELPVDRRASWSLYDCPFDPTEPSNASHASLIFSQLNPIVLNDENNCLPLDSFVQNKTSVLGVRLNPLRWVQPAQCDLNCPMRTFCRVTNLVVTLHCFIEKHWLVIEKSPTRLDDVYPSLCGEVPSLPILEFTRVLEFIDIYIFLFKY